MRNLIDYLRYLFRPRYCIIQRGNDQYFAQTYSFIYQWYDITGGQTFQSRCETEIEKRQREDRYILKFKKYTVVKEYL